MVQIHTSLINGRPGALEPTPELLNFTLARYVRLRLQKIRTLNADLMNAKPARNSDPDRSLYRRLFYSIKVSGKGDGMPMTARDGARVTRRY